MPRATDNPDRDFSADPHESDAEVVRSLLKRSDVADLFDRSIQRRIGQAISRAVFDPSKTYW